MPRETEKSITSVHEFFNLDFLSISRQRQDIEREGERGREREGGREEKRHMNVIEKNLPI